MPGRPVENFEVSVSLPAPSDHRRNRHAPLLHATEWMEAIYHQNNNSQSINNIPVISREEEVEACEPLTARKRRGMYNPQALRREISVGKSNTTETSYHLFLRHLGSSLDSDVALNEDNEISTGDVPSWFTKSTNNNEAPYPATSESQIEDPPLPISSYKICNAVAMTITPISVPPLHAINKPHTKTPPPAIDISKALPSLPVSSTSPSTSPRIDMGPITNETALHSHQPSDEEREYSRWLGEGWRVAREEKGRRKGCRVQGFAKPLRKGNTGCFGCM